MAARERDHTDRMFCANLPTEEVFTSPDAGRVEGTFACTRPLGLDGRRITGIRGEFRRGKLISIDADAPEDRDFLWSYFQRDRGASRLGELALVDSTSRIGQKGRTYGLTLLDENAVSHIAFGSGFAARARPTRRSGAPAASTARRSTST